MIDFTLLIKDFSFMKKPRLYIEVYAFAIKDLTECEFGEHVKPFKIFKKDVTFFKRNGKVIVSFGGPVEYYRDDIKRHINDAPHVKTFCIDACGRNHGVDGLSVCVYTETLKRIIATSYVIEIYDQDSLQ